MTLIALVSTSVYPAFRADRPNTSANPTAETAMPRESRTSCLRAARRSAVTALAQERLGARPVAHDEHRVLLDRVPRGVEQARAAGRRALPDPPAVLRVERRGLGGQRGGERLSRGDQRGDCRGTLRLGLARVRVVLADVRGHRPSALARLPA